MNQDFYYKISVIIPVYNVKEYLLECVESVINQTYRNLEIILVDDGSTDGSGEMCDELAKRDSRISVVHKINGGLSDARNAGLEIATGDYIGYVDSDDYIDLTMFEVLISLCIKHDLPLACARFDMVGEASNDNVPIPKHYEKLLTAEDAIEYITSSEKWSELFMTISVWDRLYRRDIVEGLRFPKGKNFEDIVYSTKAFINAGRCAYIDEALYHYRIRKGSITQQEIRFDPRWITDKLVLEKEKITLLQDNNLDKLAVLTRRIAYSDLTIIRNMCDDAELIKIIDANINELKLSTREVINLDLPLERRIKYFIKNNCGFLYKMIKKT